MKRTHRSSSPRAIRLVSLTLCYSLIVTTLFLPLSRPVSTSAHGNVNTASSQSEFTMSGFLGAPARLLASFLTFVQGGGPPSVPGSNLPDLDVARGVQFAEPIAPAAILSDQACTDCTPCPTCGPGTTNHAPGVDAGGPYYGTAGTAIVVNGLGSFDIDPEDEISVYAWTFGDGSGVFNGAMPSHTYQSPGSYSISLTVTDGHNATATAGTTASITGAPPSVPPSGPTQGNAALFIAQTVPTTMTAGQSYPVSVTMRNTGTTTWSAAHLYRLGSENPLDNSLWGTSRIQLPTTVAPGADVTFSFVVVAPFSGAEGPPPAQFQWRMVQEFVQWFDTATPSQTVTIPSNYQPPNPGGPQYGPFSNLFASRIAVDHRTGQPGEDLLSGNYNWGVGLVSLAGRAGMNLNLGLSYNSLAAWTKVVPATSPGGRAQATSFTFDADRSFTSVGFRLGFPTIQGPFANIQTGASSYLMLLPSGGRVELRRVGTTNVYEAADSSHLQLVDGGNGSLLVRTTDGTQFAYWSINSEYRCTELKDRNGNYLTIKYDPINGTANLGRMTSIIDTLGRTLDFNYDTNFRLQSITQLRNGQTHVWASFGYAALPIVTNFSSSSGPTPVVLGLPANHIVSVLTQVGLDDGSRYTFDYTSWGQVYRIKHFAVDGHQLSYTSYNLPLDNGTAQSDSPRFTQRQDWAENWNNGNVVTTNFQADSNGTWSQLTAPDGTVYREYSTTSYTDWKRGLVTKTEIYSSDDANVPKKTTITDWTQDVTNVAYPLNPRPTATTISDAEGNRRRTTIEYTTFGLPSDVYEMGPYGTSDWRTMRRTHTDYNLSESYVNRRIIGLVAGQYLFAPDANGYSIQTLLSKMTMDYDAGGEFLQDQGNPVQHDATYGTAAVVRGNLTTGLRWDVNYETDIGHATSSTVGYNTTGSAVISRDSLSHQTTVSYTDSFSANGVDSTTLSVATMAYPTTVTDPDGFSSTAKYNYDLGVVTRQQDPKGAAAITQYDAAGRVKQITNQVNLAYTRFVYPPSQTIVNRFTTINDLQHEAYVATVFDGAGRVRAAAGDFPGSTGHYNGQFTLFDIRGQAIQQTNPTEMTHLWAAAGDDAGGWISSSQTYDWKGRPLVTTNQDGTTSEASYGGCGCAGNAVVTVTDEGTLVDTDPGPGFNNVVKKRQQKIYSDALGRAFKTEVLDWDGAGDFGTGGSVYSTTAQNYNARDQVTSVKQYQGTEGSGVYQETSLTYDEYGRLKSKHTPEQNAGTATVYSYNADDTIHSVTDARGASATYLYDNNRQLVSGITYAAPSGIAIPGAVGFGYDSVGKRNSMTDDLGSVTYDYNLLSRLESETRIFNDVGSFTLSYDYNLAGELKRITDSTNMTINYGYNSIGRLTDVTGSGTLYSGVSNYGSNYQYRASGGIKQMTDGTNRTISLGYNAKLQPVHFEISGSVANQNYDYYNDGRVKFVHNTTDPNFDRSYSYDHLTRLTAASSGGAARGDVGSTPYHETFGYDALSNLTGRETETWNTYSLSDSGSFTNARRDGWGYDADGRNTSIDTRNMTFNAAGQQIQMNAPSSHNGVSFTVNQEHAYDGEGSRVRAITTQSNAPSYVNSVYYLKSSVLGGAIIEELNGSGQKTVGYVYYAGGRLLAAQSNDSVAWKHVTPAGTGKYDSYSDIPAIGRVELDPPGADVGLTGPSQPDTNGGDGEVGSNHFAGMRSELTSDIFNPAAGCVVDMRAENCGLAMIFVNFGTGNRMNLFDVGPNTGHELAHSVMLSASPEAIFAPAGNDIAGITPGDMDSSDTKQIGGVEWSQNPQTGAWTATMHIAPARVTAISAGALGINTIPQNSFAQKRSDSPINTDAGPFKGKPQSVPPPPALGLPPCLKNYLAKFFDSKMLDAITISINGIPGYVPIDADAFTLDDHIYFDPSAFDPTDGIQLSEILLAGHETTHVQQYRQNGSLRMKGEYLSNSAAVGGAASYYVGVPFDIGSYYGNKFEQQAYEMERKIREDLAKNGNPCP